MANIPSAEAMQIITIKSFNENEFEQYVVAIINKIKEAAKHGLFSVDIKYVEVTDNVNYYNNWYTGDYSLNKYGFSLFECLISLFVEEGYKYCPCQSADDYYFTLGWYIGGGE